MAVFAPKGGVGKTTVSVNLAVALRMQTRQRVLLLDADAGVGNVTAVIDVPARRGLADIADSAPEHWTDEAFRSLIVTHEASELDVLTWGFEPGDAERIGPDLLIAAVRWARQHYDIVIVDTHPGYDDRTVAMLSVANEILLTVTPEVGPLRNSAQFLHLAHELGIDDTISVVANRANHGVAIRDMESALGRPVIATIVSAGATAVMAANSGNPLVLRFPKERITQDIYRLARVVAGTEEARQAGAARAASVLVRHAAARGERHHQLTSGARRAVAGPGPSCDHPATCRPTTTDAVTAVTRSRSSTPSSRTAPRPAIAAAVRWSGCSTRPA